MDLFAIPSSTSSPLNRWTSSSPTASRRISPNSGTRYVRKMLSYASALEGLSRFAFTWPSMNLGLNSTSVGTRRSALGFLPFWARSWPSRSCAHRSAALFPVTGAFTRSRIGVPSGSRSARSTSHPSVTRSHPGAQRRRPCFRPPCPLSSRGQPGTWFTATT